MSRNDLEFEFEETATDEDYIVLEEISRVLRLNPACGFWKKQ